MPWFRAVVERHQEVSVDFQSNDIKVDGWERDALQAASSEWYEAHDNESRVIRLDEIDDIDGDRVKRIF